MRSPVPERRYARSALATIRNAWSCRKYLSGRQSRKSGENAIAVKPANFRRAVLHDRVADRHLTVAGHGHGAILANADDGGGMDYVGFHGAVDRIKSSGGGASIVPSVTCSTFQACN